MDSIYTTSNGTQGINSPIISTISVVVGWLYFLAWSISFYPQVYDNWKRRSVIGLSFDYVALNLVGWIAYSLFNCLLYWEPTMKQEYINKFGPPLPVNPNDIFFGLHAFCLTIIIIIQCIIHKRGNQNVSIIVMGIISCVIISSLVQFVLCFLTVEKWLDYLYYFSYVKVGVTLLKYIPQAYQNFVRKSTLGWSIGNILLDTTGGVLSFMQIFLDGLNTGNWQIFEGGGAKFALSIITLLFDALFIVQHYCLFRSEYTTINDYKIEFENTKSGQVKGQDPI